MSKKEKAITATYEKESKRFCRFQIDKNDLGIVGTIYVPKGEETPDSVTLSFEDE